MSLNCHNQDFSNLGSVGAINLPMPCFKFNDPQLWFVRLEHFFMANHITSQNTKFGYTSSVLPEEVAEQVRETLLKPHPDTPYDVLKQEVLKATSLSDQKAVDQLLSSICLGDRTPSQLKRHMQSLLKDRNVDNRLFYQLWLRRLPSCIQQILAVGDADIDIDRLADIADRMYERMPKPVESIAEPTQNDRVAALERKIDILTGQLTALQLNRRSPKFCRSRSRSRDRTTSRIASKSRTCWYHKKFGSKARRCLLPCDFKTFSSGNGKAGDQ
ncbi:unnamed protein product [Heterobilharzia americana]|nr:unnamed protein product [Heterobilharzia americana]